MGEGVHHITSLPRGYIDNALFHSSSAILEYFRLRFCDIVLCASPRKYPEKNSGIAASYLPGSGCLLCELLTETVRNAVTSAIRSSIKVRAFVDYHWPRLLTQRAIDGRIRRLEVSHHGTYVVRNEPSGLAV